MPHKIIFTLFLALFAGLSAVAQTEPEAPPRVIFSPGPSTSVRLFQKILRLEEKSPWLLADADEVQAFVGISEAQKNHLNERLKFVDETLNDKEARLLVESLNRWQELPEEEITRLDDALAVVLEKAIDMTDSIVTETLTQPQLQSMREYALVTPSVFEIQLAEILGDGPDHVTEFTVNFGAYEALDLAGEQKETLAKLQKKSQEDMQPVWNDVKTFLESMHEKAQSEDFDFDFQEIIPKIDAIRDRAASLAKQTRETIKEHLTLEQRERLAEIREEVPKRLAKIKEEFEKKKAEAAKDESWKDAWKPGDPIPEDLRVPEPQRRFPFRM